jgi:hypothetical protein
VQKQVAAIGAARAASAPALKPPPTAEELLGIPFKPGQRVLDSITGQEGTVNAGTIRNTFLPPS